MSTYRTPEGRLFKFNDHVVAEMVLGVKDEERTGRLVQVRKGVGSFGSDILLIRLRCGKLVTFENALLRHVNDPAFEEAFYRSNGRPPPVVPEQPPTGTDGEDVTYLIGDRWPEAGFVIARPKQPASRQQSFSMMVSEGRAER